MKKGQLYNYHNEIQRWIQAGSILAYFNRSRISDFYKEYGQRIETLNKTIEAHQRSFYQIEGEGEKERIKIVEGKPVLIEGKTEADANQAWEDLMNEELTIKMIKI